MTSPLFLSRRRFSALALGGALLPVLPGALLGCASRSILHEGADSPGDLPRASPDAMGTDPALILDFLDAVEAAGLELHGFMLARHGTVIAEGFWWPYRADRVHMTHSLTKSVTACAVGLAISEGRFSLKDRVTSFFPQYVPGDASENLLAMTVEDLLTMRTGHDHATSGSVWRPIQTSWVAEFMKIPVPLKPGSKWIYTSAASFMLSAIVTATTGQTVHEYLRPRMFDPLGIRHEQWDLSPGGITTGGNGLSWPLAASLKLGMLHGQRGMWGGKRVLPADWVDAATRRQVSDGPYGYQWWIGEGSAYYADGLFSQLSIVFPEHDATIAVFAAIEDSSLLLPHVWQHFPRAFSDRREAAPAATSRLQERLRNLRLLPPLALTASPVAGRISGRDFSVTPNDQSVSRIQFDFDDHRVRYSMTDERGTHVVVSGLDSWIEQDTTMTGHRLHHEYQPPSMRVVAGARWIDTDTLEMTWQFVESAFRDTVTCHFDGDRLTLDRSVNLNTAERSLPTLAGTLAPT